MTNTCEEKRQVKLNTGQGHIDDDACQSVVYFFGPSTMYWGFGSMAFLLRDQPGVDVLPGEMPGDINASVRFAFVNLRRGELTNVQSAYPDGLVTEVKASDGRVLMTLYDWKAENAP